MSAMRRAINGARVLGFDVGVFLRTLSDLPRFVSTLRAYRRMAGSAEFPIRARNLRPMLADRMANAGVGSGHYFHQDLWAARKVFNRRPVRHVDIGSRIDGFVAHLLVFMPVEVIDIRPLTSGTVGLTFVQGDVMSRVGLSDSAVDSMSCLHALEHFGLGRYGDPVDPVAWRGALAAMERALRPGGRFYLSVPIGVERVEFNAHRVFAPRTILGAVPLLSLVTFSAVDDNGELHEDVGVDEFASARFACGLFEFTK